VEPRHRPRLDDAREIQALVRLQQQRDERLGGWREAGRERRADGCRIGLEQALELVARLARGIGGGGGGQGKCSFGWPFGLPGA
jgi:hypothetical protein